MCRLGLCTEEPFFLFPYTGVGSGEHDVVVGKNYSERCTQFVGCVRQKLLLLAPRLFHRIDGNFGHEKTDEEEDDHAGRT